MSSRLFIVILVLQISILAPLLFLILILQIFLLHQPLKFSYTLTISLTGPHINVQFYNLTSIVFFNDGKKVRMLRFSSLWLRFIPRYQPSYVPQLAAGINPSSISGEIIVKTVIRGLHRCRRKYLKFLGTAPIQFSPLKKSISKLTYW